MMTNNNVPKEAEDDEGGIDRSHPKKGGQEEEGSEKRERLVRLKHERDEFQKQYPTDRGKK